MAESSSAAASTSTSTAANSNYDVFLNHRGVDVKKTFASHLYHRLRSCGLRVFLDQSELQRGDDFTLQIRDAIQSASVHVAIFSDNYADSTWCLNELVQMLHSKKPIIPVFYHVKPSDLRWTQHKTQGQKRSYAEALEELERKTESDPQTHEQKLRHSSCQMEIWRKTLCEVANISGFELEACNGDEGELVEKVIEAVSEKVKKPALDLYVAKYPTGLDDKINDFQNTVLLQLQQSGKSQIFGIVGIMGLGGVGKTTLTKEFFNRKKSDYSSSCFLSDVRDNAGKGLVWLQKKLLNSLYVRDKAIERVDGVDEGKVMLRTHLSSANALIILDDVDAVDQVDFLLPVLPSNCLILITSRDRDVLLSSQIEESSIYNLTGLNTEHSLELFCSHAFNRPDPLPGFEYLVEKFLEACNGLPLSLKVFGAHLYGKKLSDWEHELGSPLPTEIQHILKRSYNSLTSQEQNIFLDIACFFRGQNQDRAIMIWDGSGWEGRRGFENLRNRCLVEVDRGYFIQMHDHIRDLGRDIAKEPGLPCRLWRWTENDINDLLEGPPVRAVRGIRMALSQYDDIDVHDALGHIRMRRLRLLDTEGVLVERILAEVQFPNLIWLRWNKCPYSSLPSSISMKNLRVLHVEGRQLESLWENESQAPLQLQELNISAPLSNIPKFIGKLKHLERFVIGPIYGNGSIIPDTKYSPQGFRLYRSSDGSGPVVPLTTKLPEEFGLLQSLQVLALIDCSEMKSLPDSFGNLTNLCHIQLNQCRGLEKLPDSFCKLIKLECLDLKNCTNLTMSSETLGNINTLLYIDLTSCGKIDLLPPQVAHQRWLQQLHFGGTNVKELPSAIGELSYLESVGIGGPLLDRLPASLGVLRNLNKLTIWGCEALECLPPSLGLLTQLTVLWVVNCPLIRELPFKKDSSIDNRILPRLQQLTVSWTGISEVSFAEGVCCNLLDLKIYRCDNVVEVGTLPNTLTSLEFLHCDNLRKIDELYVLAKLQTLVISYCKELEELPRIETLVSLCSLNVSRCVKLKSTRGLWQLTKLRQLDVSGCSELEEVEGIQDCMSLRSLDATECPKLQWSAVVVEQLTQRCSTFCAINDYIAEGSPLQSTHDRGLEYLYFSYI